MKEKRGKNESSKTFIKKNVWFSFYLPVFMGDNDDDGNDSSVELCD